MANWRLIAILAVALLLAVAAVVYAQTLAAPPAQTRHDHEHGRFRIYYNPLAEGSGDDLTFLLDAETGDAWQLRRTKGSNHSLQSELAWRKMPKD